MIERSRWREELQARFSPSKTWPGPEIEEGWKDVVCDLADALDATGIRYSFVQLASHAGALSCLLGTGEDEPRMEELHDLVDRARERSRLTCPRCGKTGCACPTFSISAALAQLQPFDWQEAERRAQRLKESVVAQQALAAVAAGTSMVPTAARDRLRAGLDALSMDTEWTGPMVAWLDYLLRAQGAARTKTGITAEGLVTHTLQDCLPLANLISGYPVFDASELNVPPGVPLAMVRQDATLVLPVAAPARVHWLQTFATDLGMENLVVVEQAVDEQRDRTLFQEIISRDGAPARAVLERTRHRMALGGRWFLLRAQVAAAELQGLPQGAQFVQAIAIPAPGLEAPRQILHIATGAGQTAPLPMHQAPQAAAPAPLEDLWSDPGPSGASLTIPEILAAARVTLERIEAEMKRIGFWSENPPPLLEMANRGELGSYLDAPSFEQWLQCVFLARAHAAVRSDSLPSSSSVAEMARRQYDYHSYLPEAQPLLALLRAFDLLVDQRAERERSS
ncbi:MAG TPA: YqcC family protein [Burkholderiales bacterium]|jgi:16S rRNA (guanine527-N7)-methyltransferase|nr:YqcC family protein [Burkholderiales bacterium]